MTRTTAGGRAVLYAALVAWFVVPLTPLVLWTFAASWAPATRLPQAFGLSSLATALSDAGGAAFLRSLVLGSVVATLATPVGAMAARALILGRVRLPGLVSALLLAPVALPVFAVVMGLDTILLRLRVPGPVGIVLVLSVVAIPYTAYVMRVAYGAYSFEFEDEARTLGATRRDVWWRVRLPLLTPGLAAATFLAFLVGWSDYIVTLLVGGGRVVTLPILVASAASGTGNEPTVAALSVVALLPPVVALGSAALLRRSLAPRRNRTVPEPPAPSHDRSSSTQGAT